MKWSDMTPAGADTEGEIGTAHDTRSLTAPHCPTCSFGRLHREMVHTSIWMGRRLVIVEDVPALVCRTCGEQYYEDETSMTLDLMRGAGFPESRAARFVSVPVFSFDNGGGPAWKGGKDDAP